MITNSQIDFHDTFPPQLNYLSKILELAKRDYIGNKDEISDLTGIPTGKVRGKVVPHIKYAKYMNLIEYKNEGGKFHLSLTDMGSEIYTQDKYLLENITKELCNYWLCDDINGAPQWAYLLKQFPHTYNDEVSMDFFKSKACDYFGYNIEFSVVKSGYLNGCFDTLDLFEWDNNSIIFKSKHYRFESVYV